MELSFLVENFQLRMLGASFDVWCPLEESIRMRSLLNLCLFDKYIKSLFGFFFVDKYL